jgi:hypothetical protein
MRLPAYNYNVTVTHSERLAFVETPG